jgi:hydroxyacylglutathione hydrolase
MSQDIKTIDLGGVNCYLLEGNDTFMLVDCGFANKRTFLEKKLDEAGCRPGKLMLVILTHGDVDHAGNGLSLQNVYAAKIAMHEKDAGMVEHGDMSWNRKDKPDKMAPLFKLISIVAPLFARADDFETFKPDLIIDEGFDLQAYGIDGKVLHTPGHSKGSIAILTGTGDLICGDLLYNFTRPDCLCIDDAVDFKASLEKLKTMNIRTVYPGHGKPFPIDRFWKSYQGK